MIDSSWADVLSVASEQDFYKNLISLSFITVLVATILQWIFGLRMTALTESFSRKRQINDLLINKPQEFEHLLAGGATAERNLQQEKVQQLVLMYMELDNLEYVFDRYREGGIDHEVALRQCLIFASRCLNDEFRELVADNANRGLTSWHFRRSVCCILLFTDNHLKRLIEDEEICSGLPKRQSVQGEDA